MVRPKAVWAWSCFRPRRHELQPGWVVVAASFAVMFGVWVPHAGFGVFLPVLSQEFAWSRGAISLAASLNLLLGGAISFGVGAASDRYGPRRILALSGLLVGAGYILASTVGALWHFYLWVGGVLGIGMSGVYIVPTATVSRWFVERRGLALGVLLTGINLAYVTAGPLVALLIDTVGWRAAYVALGGLVLAVVVPASAFMKVAPSGEGSRVAAAPGLEHSAPAAPRGASVTFREAVRDRRLWLLVLTWVLQGAALMTVAVHVVAYLHDRGTTLEAASLALTIYGVSSMAGRLLFGAAADRIGTTPTFYLCSVLQVVGLAWVAVGPSLWLFYPLIMAFGLGAAGADTAVVKAASEVFGVRAIGAIIGIVGVGWRCGAALGPAVAGFLHDATGSYGIAFGLASAGVLLSLAFFTLGMSSSRRAA